MAGRPLRRQNLSRRNNSPGGDHAIVIVKPLARGREHVVEHFLRHLGANAAPYPLWRSQ